MVKVMVNLLANYLVHRLDHSMSDFHSGVLSTQTGDLLVVCLLISKIRLKMASRLNCIYLTHRVESAPAGISPQALSRYSLEALALRRIV